MGVGGWVGVWVVCVCVCLRGEGGGAGVFLRTCLAWKDPAPAGGSLGHHKGIRPHSWEGIYP